MNLFAELFALARLILGRIFKRADDPKRKQRLDDAKIAEAVHKRDVDSINARLNRVRGDESES